MSVMSGVVFTIKADGQQAVDALQKLDKTLGNIDAQAVNAAAGLKSLDQTTDSLRASLNELSATGAAALSGLQPQQVAAVNAQLSTLAQRLQASGMSAAEVAFKMRQIPMQMTDVVTSLASGMNPMQVLIQQGGQLKDSFGSVGLALRAVGGYVAGLLTPINLAVVAVGAFAAAAYIGGKEADEFRKQVLLTGNAVGASADQLAGLASQVHAVSGATKGAAAEALAALVGTAAVGRASLVDYAQTAMAMEKSFGQSIETTTKHFAELGKDPVGASKRLNETMNYLTAATYAQIRAAADQGDKARAAALAQDEYAKAMAARAKDVQQNLGYVEKAWNAVAGAAKWTWDAMLGLGREDSVSEKLGKLQKQLEDRQAALRRFGNRADQFGAPFEAQIQSLKEQIGYLQEQERMQKRAGDAAAERAQREKDGIAAVDEKAKAADEAKKKAQQEAEARARAQVKLVEDGVKAYGDLIAQQGGLAPDFAEKWGQLSAAFAAHKLNTEQLTQAQAALLAQQPAMKKIAEDRLKLEKQIADEQAKTLAEAWKAADATGAQADQQARANATFGKGKVALAELTLAELNQTLVALEQTENVIPGRIQALEMQIDAQKRLIREMKAGESLEANDKAAKKAEEEWKRTAESIERSLTDALMRGFESGKSFVENFRDTLVNMFKTMVLRPTIQAFVTTVTGLGGAGSATAQGVDSAASMSNSLGLASSVGSLYKNITSGFTLLGDKMAFAADEIGTWLVNNTTGILNKAGGTLLESAGTIGTVASYASGALAGYGLGKAISGQYTTALGKNTLEIAGTAIGAIWGPLGAAIGGAIGGLVNRAFGMGAKESTDYGLTGVLSSAGASVSQYSSWHQDGGWFRSDRGGTDYSGVSTELQSLLDTAVRATTAATAGYAQAIGLGAQSVYGYTQSINLSLKGLDQAGQEKAIAGALSNFGAGMVSAAYGQALQAFTKTGESLSDTLARLSTSLTAVNQVFDTLNVRLLDIGVSGADAASKLLDVFGGAQAFVQQTSAYYTAFYSDAERVDTTTRQLRAALVDLGVQMPQNVHDLRSLVDAQDLSTDAGRKTYAALISLTGSFKAVFDAQTKAADEAAKAQQNYVQAMLDGGKKIADWINALDSSSLGVGSDLQRNLQQARGSYLQTLSLARSGDTAAMGEIIGQANAYLQAAQGSSSSSSQYQAIVAQVKAEMGNLPATKSYQMQTLDALDLISSTIVDGFARSIASMSGSFKALDTNVDGLLTFDELKQGLNGKATDRQIELMILAADKNGDGQISAIEAQTAVSQSLVDGFDGGLADILRRFSSLDANVDGLLTFDELRQGLSGKASDEQLQALIRVIDTNGDGQISAIEAQTTLTEALKNSTDGVADNTDLLQQKSDSQLKALIQINNDGIYAVSKNTAKALDYLDSIALYAKNIDTSTAMTAANPVVVNQSSGGGGFLSDLFGGLFADGAVFDGQGVYSSVTPFMTADGRVNIMGEAGPEGVLPLERMADGALGVRATRQIVQERYVTMGDTTVLEQLLDQLIGDSRAQAQAIVAMQSRMTRLLERWDGAGMPEVRVVA